MGPPCRHIRKPSAARKTDVCTPQCNCSTPRRDRDRPGSSRRTRPRRLFIRRIALRHKHCRPPGDIVTGGRVRSRPITRAGPQRRRRRLHHRDDPASCQAVMMAELVEGRTQNRELIELADTIEDAQEDEIDQMAARLRSWGRPDGGAHGRGTWITGGMGPGGDGGMGHGGHAGDDVPPRGDGGAPERQWRRVRSTLARGHDPSP